MLRGRSSDRAALHAWHRALELAVTQTFLLDERSPSCGRTIADLALRSSTGVTIVAVTRNGKPLLAPQPDLQLQTGDVLVLVGSHAQLDDAKRQLAGPDERRDDADEAENP
jgi:K+/H+ antiporter YhaU regulatory subunit KhtT